MNNNAATLAKHAKISAPPLSEGGARQNLLLLLAGLALINGIFYGLYALKLLFPAQFPFFYNPLESYAGLFCDFYNPVLYAYHLNIIDFQWSNAPPFLHFLCYLLTLPLRLFTAETGGLAMAYSLPGQVGFALLALGMLAALSALINHAATPHLRRHERYLLCLMASASYPVFFAIAGGNLSLLAAALVALFVLQYEQEHYGWAALWLGMSAALKLYPALLGIIFLCDKRWRAAFLCAATGIGLTLLSLAVFKGGVIANLLDFLQKAAGYNRYGNLDLRRIMLNNNSLLMLWDIPFFISRNGAVSLEEMALHNDGISPLLTGIMLLSVGSCFFLRRRQDKLLLLSLWMVGYPYNSEPYNLTMLIAPLVLWAGLEERRNTPMLVMGVLLCMCKTRFAAYATTVRLITLQSILNPLLIAGMLLWLYFLRRKEMREDISAALHSGTRRIPKKQQS